MPSRRYNGEGSFVKMPSGNYKMRLRVGMTDDGKDKVLTVTAPTITECKKLMAVKKRAYIASKLTGKDVEGMTLLQLCELHLREHRKQKGRLKDTSADRRECTINNQIKPYAISKLQVQAVRGPDVSDYIEELIAKELAISTIEKAFNVVNAAYKWAILKQYLDTNPCMPVMDEIKNRLSKLDMIRKSEEDIIILSKEEQTILKEYANSVGTDFALSALFLLYTGMRVGELSALKWHNYNIKSGVLQVYLTRHRVQNRDKDGNMIKGTTYKDGPIKNYVRRDISLNSDARAILEKMYARRKDDDYIFIADKGGPYDVSNYDKKLKDLYVAAGINPEGLKGAHTMRRTCATNLYDAGASVERIARYLGDTEETIRKYYISTSRKLIVGGEAKNVIPYPEP